MKMTKFVSVLIIVMIGLATTMAPVIAYRSSEYIPSLQKVPYTYIPKIPGHSMPGKPGGGTPVSGSCPIDALKLGACVDLLGGLVHVGAGDPVVNKCCPLLQGIAELEAALCLCTTIRAKVLNVNIILPLALELFAQCGLTPPAGFTCPSSH